MKKLMIYTKRVPIEGWTEMSIFNIPIPVLNKLKKIQTMTELI
jgi:hypothetical protein